MTTPRAVAVAHPSCGAKTRPGATHARCQLRAGWGTDHVGEGRCKLHGGVSGTLTHGRYSTVTRTRVRELIAQHEADPDPLNILPEIAALRALFQEFIERYDVHTAALLAWHESYKTTRRPLPEPLVASFTAIVDEWEIDLRERGDDATDKQQEDLGAARQFLLAMRGAADDGKPHQLLDLTDAYRVLGEIGRMVERVEKVKAANAISRGDFLRLHMEMTRVVNTYVQDPLLREKIADGWLDIRI